MFSGITRSSPAVVEATRPVLPSIDTGSQRHDSSVIDEDTIQAVIDE